jgi:hypothetical protein
MGWTSFTDNANLKASEILTRELTGKNSDGATWEIVDHATKSREFYAICKFTAPNNAPIFYGVVVLFSRKNGEFGYKEMGETCGPNAARAPVRIIDALDRLAPIDPLDARQSAQWAKKWREACRTNAKRKPKTIVKPGDIVKFSPHGAAFELLAPAGPRRGWHVKLTGESGFRQTYRATAQQVNQCIVIQ